MAQRHIPKNHADFAAMDVTRLHEQRAAIQSAMRELEHPGLWKRLQRAGARVGAAAIGFGLTIFAADKAFLAKSRMLLEDSRQPHTAMEDKTDAQLVAETYGNAPEGQQLAWPCEGCGGCPGGMAGCRPAFKPREDARFTPATVEGAAEWARNRLRLEQPGHTPISQSTHDRQMIAAGAAASGVALLLANMADRLLGKPEQQIQKLQHQLQHVEGLLAERSQHEHAAMAHTLKVA
jgi:hypothetical protein